MLSYNWRGSGISRHYVLCKYSWKTWLQRVYGNTKCNFRRPYVYLFIGGPAEQLLLLLIGDLKPFKSAIIHLIYQLYILFMPEESFTYIPGINPLTRSAQICAIRSLSCSGWRAKDRGRHSRRNEPAHITQRHPLVSIIAAPTTMWKKWKQNTNGWRKKSFHSNWSLTGWIQWKWWRLIRRI